LVRSRENKRRDRQPDNKIRLSKIDPDDAGGAIKKKGVHSISRFGQPQMGARLGRKWLCACSKK
jgi:hypothetical protein